jgi:hypothetical protein
MYPHPDPGTIKIRVKSIGAKIASSHISIPRNKLKGSRIMILQYLSTASGAPYGNDIL